MRLFVTGSASFIASALIDRCDEYSLETAGCDLAEQSRLNHSYADIRDSNLSDLIDEDTDTLVHLAAISREADCKNKMDQWLDINVQASRNVMLAAHRRGVRQVVFASSEWVYDFDGERERTEDDPIDPTRISSEYGLSKLMAESLLRQTAEDLGVSLSVLRFGIVYGPRRKNWSAVESILNAVACRDRVMVGSLATARRFIHVDDVASAILRNCGREGIETFNVQGPGLVTLGDVVAAAKRITGKNPEVLEQEPDVPSVRPVSAELAARRLNWRAEIDIEPGMRSIAPIVLERENA